MPTLTRWNNVLVRPFTKIASCSTCLLATACQHLWQFANYGSYVGSHVFTIPLSLASYRMMLAVLARLRRLVLPFRAEYIVGAASHRTVTSPACAPRLRREKPSVLSGRILATTCRTVTYATSCRTGKLCIIVQMIVRPLIRPFAAGRQARLRTGGNCRSCDTTPKMSATQVRPIPASVPVRSAGPGNLRRR